MHSIEAACMQLPLHGCMHAWKTTHMKDGLPDVSSGLASVFPLERHQQLQQTSWGVQTLRKRREQRGERGKEKQTQEPGRLHFEEGACELEAHEGGKNPQKKRDKKQPSACVCCCSCCSLALLLSSTPAYLCAAAAVAAAADHNNTH